MQIIIPDILEEARGLSAVITLSAFLIGLLLWTLGWAGHRFWIVLIATIGGGLYGLQTGPSYGTQPWVAGLLVSLSAGLLALALVRLLAFVAGGIAGVLLVRGLMPNWHEPLVASLVGGLVGLLLFRLWMMVLSSAAGALLMAYSGLCLAHTFGKLDCVAMAESQSFVLNCACGGLALLGVLVQYFLDRARGERTHRRFGLFRVEESNTEDESVRLLSRSHS